MWNKIKSWFRKDSVKLSSSMAQIELKKIDYADMFTRLEINTEHNKVEYLQILKLWREHMNMYCAWEKIVLVPAWFLFAVDYRESTCDQTCNFLNGQPLYKRTTIEPKNQGPFFSKLQSIVIWKELKKDQIPNDSKLDSWLKFAEKNNGLGYLMREKVSPYIFAGSQYYVSGLFSSDGHYRENMIDYRYGVAVILKILVKNNLISGIIYE